MDEKKKIKFQISKKPTVYTPQAFSFQNKNNLPVSPANAFPPSQNTLTPIPPPDTAYRSPFDSFLLFHSSQYRGKKAEIPQTTTATKMAKSQPTDFENQKGKWPDELVKYVNQCFAHCAGKKSKNKIRKALKKGISAVLNTAALGLEKMDWAIMPLLTPSSATLFDMNPCFETLMTSPGCFRAAARAENTTQNEPLELTNPLVLGGGMEVSASAQQIGERQKRFGSSAAVQTGGAFANTNSLFSAETDAEPDIIVGTSRELEKPYLRLTSKPDASKVRPPEVLKESFELAMRKMRREKKYSQCLEQLKAIRQDLSVQHIKSSFAVQVYEANARLCIDAGDLSEFNQCQTQLLELDSHCPGNWPNKAEFWAYRLLYYVLTRETLGLHTASQELCESSELVGSSQLLADVIEILKKLRQSDFLSLFSAVQRVESAPARVLLAQIVQGARREFLRRVFSAYAKFPLRKLMAEMGLGSLGETESFAAESGAKIIRDAASDSAYIDCRASAPAKKWAGAGGPKNVAEGVTHGCLDATLSQK